jgi:acetyl esterase/lipase
MGVASILRRAVVLAGAVMAGRAVARRQRLVADVPSDLRTPFLYLPGVDSDRSLRVARWLTTKVPFPAPKGVTISERTTARRDGGEIRIVVYEPDVPRARPSGALLWIHGGGMVFGVPEQSHETCAHVARELGILVASVDYRVAPEDPFPAPLDDCMDALAWLHAHAGDLGIDPDRLAVGGDSAGGGLAAAVSQRAHDEGELAVAFQALVYPMIDDRTVLRDGPDTLVWSRASNRFGWTAYLGRAPRWDDAPAYAAPARREDLRGLPPAWIGVGDIDLFHDEDVDYARRLQEAGVPCELHVVPGMFHGADGIVRRASASVEFRDRLTDALRGAVGSSPAAAPR